MSSEHTDEEAIYHEAAAKPPAERAAYLKVVCGEDGALIARMEALLKARDINDDFLKVPPLATAAELDSSSLTEAPGATIGRYKLLEKIGEGGMAVVYMAEQQEPIHRKVALKIIKLGMDTRQVIARFEAERQALAMMDHPNMARVFDAGATETGRPYFVMELVEGASITEYCDANSLSTKERLELFIQVCNAVQHAHQKGVIHRDIKPSNVMVAIHDGKPVPKVIDFGIAKATNQRLTEKTVFTRYAQMIGTPAYMSPEQAELSDLDVDTRTDIYSLGVLLYELLTGTTPFKEEELRQAGYLEMQRIIAKQEPAKPSTKLNSLGDTLTEIANRRNSTPDLLRKAVRGDLDWIVMKALEKQRDRRYDTAAELSADIDRHLNHEPVQAVAPSFSYKTCKFIRRHRIGVVVAFLVSLAILAVLSALSVATVLIWREQGRTQRALEREQKALQQEIKARTEAQRQTKIAQAVVDFLNNDLLASVDPDRTRGREVTVREILDEASQKIGGRFNDEPLIEASVHLTLGNAYTELGEYGQAARQLERARQLHQEHLKEDDPAALESMRSLGWLYVKQGRYEQAEPLLDEAVRISERALGEEHPCTLACTGALASLRRGQGRYEQAEKLNRKIIEVQTHLFGEDHLGTLNVMHNLATLYSEQGRYQEAEDLYRKVLEIKMRLLGEDHPDTLRTMNNLAVVFKSRGQYQQAEELFFRTWQIKKRVFGEEHPETLATMHNLAVAYDLQKRYQDAEALYAKALAIQTRVLGDEHPDTLNTVRNLATLYKDQQQYDRAEPLYRKAAQISERVLGKEHPDTLSIVNLLIAFYETWDKPEEAAAWRAKLPQMAAEPSTASSAEHVEGVSSAKPAPAFTLQDLDGRQVSLSDFKGKVVLLDFWGTWCPPCLKAIPHMEALHKKYKDQGLVVIGLNHEPDQAKVKQFAQDWMSYIVLPGADKPFAEYGVQAIPTLFYIDAEGMVRYQETGFIDGREKDIEAKIGVLLGLWGSDRGRPSPNHQASEPSPADASDVGPAPSVELRWTPAADAAAQRVYFGPDPNNLVLLAEIRSGSAVNSPTLQKQQWHFWRVDAVRADGSVVEGERWSFSTGDLVGWWRLDESEGRIAADSSGRSHHGSLIGNPQWQPGRIGGALAFDGQDDYALIKDMRDFNNITKEITVACWINIAKFDKSWQAIIAKGNRAWRLIRPQYGRSIEFACTGVNVPNSAWGNVFGTSVVDDGQWHHLTGAYDGMQVRLYVDGVLDASIEGAGEINSTGDYVLIGANAGDAWNYWRGLIDDVRVYSYALTETQVKELYAGRGPGPNEKPHME